MSEQEENKLEYVFSPHWRHYGPSLMMYHPPEFQFKTTAIIIDLENGLIKSLSNNKIYNKMSSKPVEPYNLEFVKKLMKDNDNSIILISNCDTAKITVDATKQKLEMFLKQYNMPILCLFSLLPNYLSKPHTRIWKFLLSYFSLKGNKLLNKACVISDNSGRILRKDLKTKTIYKYDKSDIDRAFANNIELPFYTINEFLTGKKEKFTWNNVCISPEQRIEYLDKLAQYKNPDICELLKTEMKRLKADTFIILVFGAPRSGKSRFCAEFVESWKKDQDNEQREIRILDTETKSRVKTATKCIKDLINIVIDGDCHTSQQREPFNILAKETRSAMLVIEVNPGIVISYLLNHVAVEKANSEKIMVRPERDFYVYRSKEAKPSNSILYCPEIDRVREIMDLRF